MPYDIISTVEEGCWRGRIGCLDQDIVVGEWVEVEEGLAKYFSPRLKRIGKLFLPHAIVEVKYGGVDSHGLTTYSHIAQRIRQVFNDVRYYLLVRFDNKRPATYKRHGVGFDTMAVLQNDPEGGKPATYRYGQFRQDLADDKVLKERFERFLKLIDDHLGRERRLLYPTERQPEVRARAANSGR